MGGSRCWVEEGAEWNEVTFAGMGEVLKASRSAVSMAR